MTSAAPQIVRLKVQGGIKGGIKIWLLLLEVEVPPSVPHRCSVRVLRIVQRVGSEARSSNYL
eukprot:CAMPEP_0181464846 /NCGR_PEP_ID=MMETSP1110-20121109/35644_1 /TAXON_ID=174948 /ORGANISM="Symbiodinium sp., Strain CCMP421" /LENGTH=61 /DNA_ID=CAMNT_0023589595 /DNA_START=13 /DNA_END=198 /DNA_ORIENTATION=+